MTRYRKAVDRKPKSKSKSQERGLGAGGAIFFAVCRGKVSEGIDFADRHARAVFIVGIPYPSAYSLDVVLKKRHCDMVRLVSHIVSVLTLQ